MTCTKELYLLAIGVCEYMGAYGQCASFSKEAGR